MRVPVLQRLARQQLPLQLVIFDCDGVLVDSERMTHEVLVAALSDLGINLEVDEAMRLFMGSTLAGVIAKVETLLGAPLPERFIGAWRARLYDEFRERPVLAVAGVEALLSSLSLPCCVVSNGPFEKMRTTLGVTGLLNRFDGKLYSPDMGLRGKPHPDLLLAAARDFKIEPGQVLVVEDSPSGVRAAKAAGMRVCGFAAASHTDAAALAAAGAEVLYDMQDVGRIVAAASRET
jgi:HAD superfamily hydrolase (TIGR01509 family)